MTSFEVNTDIALVDPDWEIFEQEHERRYGLAISYVKSVVTGENYNNDVMNLCAGDNGFYMQSVNFPAAFFGDTGQSSIEFVSDEEAQELVFEAVAHYRAGDAKSLTCVYSNANPGDVFFGYRLDGEERYEWGFLRAGVPLHLRVMVESEESSDLLGSNKGVLVLQRLENKNLIIKALGRRQPFMLMNGIDEDNRGAGFYKAQSRDNARK